MQIIMESLYHYLWGHRMLGSRFQSRGGSDVEVISPGVHNQDSGPDFSAARLRIDGEDWVGNIEIHVRASDWKRHGHHADPAYDSIILHVVGVDDAEVTRSDGSPITQVCVSPSPDFYHRYAALTAEMDLPGCMPFIGTVPEINRKDWVDTLGIERLHRKAGYIKDMLAANRGDWQQALFIVVARALGFGLNGLPFELLAKSLPLNFVMRHRDNPMQIEALVFGQAGMLDGYSEEGDDYHALLKREYEFLKKKYLLVPIDVNLWKYARTRPHNFPHRRLAILAAMLAGGMQLHSRLLEAAGRYEEITDLFQTSASDYWRRHHRFGAGESAIPLPVTLSRGSVDLLCINVAAPFYFAYGAASGNPDLAERGLELLYEIRAERNSVVGVWRGTPLEAANAFESQALLQLRRVYCQSSLCLECRLGHYLLRQTLK